MNMHTCTRAQNIQLEIKIFHQTSMSLLSTGKDKQTKRKKTDEAQNIQMKKVEADYESCLDIHAC